MNLDQHFMIDEDLCKRIVSYANIKSNEVVLEVGPGKGALTKYLTKKTKKLVLVELSFELTSELMNEFKNVKIINESITKFKELNFDKIIGNIPYSICEPLINKLLKSKFNLCILTVPEKFLEKDLLNLIIYNLLEIKTLMNINKKEFSPKPKVNSKVIEIKKKELNNQERLIKKIYICSDKKLKNIINTNLSFKEKKVRELNLDEWKVLLNDIKRA